MLNESPADTEKVKAWLVAALTAGKRQGKSAAGLAAHCEVKPQAVNGWKTTGRITKTNLAKATAYFGHGPSFLSQAVAAHEAAAPWRSAAPDEWPHRFVSREEWQALDAEQRAYVESRMREAIDQLHLATVTANAKALSRKPQRAA